MCHLALWVNSHNYGLSPHVFFWWLMWLLDSPHLSARHHFSLEAQVVVSQYSNDNLPCLQLTLLVKGIILFYLHRNPE
jgi:hypothetical protein